MSEKKKIVRTKIDEERTEYSDPELREKIVILRAENDNWPTITKKIQEEFENTISEQTIQRIYHKQIAKSITIDKIAGKNFNAFEDELEAMYGRTIKIMKGLLDSIEKVRDAFEASDMDDLEIQLRFMKMIPQIEKTIHLIFKAIDVETSRADKIRLEQKNAYYSPLEINKEIHKTLKILVEGGYMKVLKKLPFEDGEDMRKS